MGFDPPGNQDPVDEPGRVNKKKRFLAIALIILIGVISKGAPLGKTEPSSPLACTSFAVYSGSPLYGMNFDYPEVPVRFTIREFGDLQVFQMEFKDEGGYIPTVGLNNEGLFASSQMLFPEMPPTPSGGEKQMSIWQLYQAGLYRHRSVAEVLNLADEYQITNSSLTLHGLFADPRGAAVVVEVINDQEELVHITGKYIVMTNFPVSSIQGQPIDEVEGVGADRYQIAVQIIRENIDNFQVDTGLRILEESALLGEFSTQASMVFDPINLLIYIALDRDFSKVWLVSLKDNTISTFRGFTSQQTLPLDQRGVTEEVMVEMGLSLPADQIQFLDLLLPIALLSILVLIIWSLRRLTRKTPMKGRGG